MIEEREFDVEITVSLRTLVSFAPAKRDGPITVLDAIVNAIGSMPDEDWHNITTGWDGEFITDLKFEVYERK